MVYKWTPECDAELEYLKDCLVREPILRTLDPNRDIIVATDGSKYGLGWAILQQDDDGRVYAVSYGAKATTPAQSNYPADDLEAIALVYALKSIEPMAISRRIIHTTDNSHLLHLHTWKPVNARQRRMLAYLMQYRLTVRYVRGVRNLLPDCLSRLFQDSTVEERQVNESKYVQEQDDFILPVTTRFQSRTALNVPEAEAVSAPQSSVRAAADISTEVGGLGDPPQTSDGDGGRLLVRPLKCETMKT